MQDIKINTSDVNFKFRVNGIIIKDEKVLTVQMNKNGFYCLPGGHVELGENSITAIKREMLEEVNVHTKNEKLIALNENFFSRTNGKRFHELSFYYLVDIIENIETKDYEIIEHDKDQDILLEFKWIPLKNLKNENFKPQNLQDKLYNLDFKFIHSIIQ